MQDVENAVREYDRTSGRPLTLHETDRLIARHLLASGYRLLATDFDATVE
jgi:hypothetical protein